MNPRPVIFVSAVSRELRSARQLVANTLTFLGYDPIWQDIFETSEGEAGCTAVSGGDNNVATGFNAAVSGGSHNHATGISSAVSAGAFTLTN